jgi:hypothetical protein
MNGAMCPGHHATLHFPAGEGTGLVSTSQFAWGEVSPRPLEDPSERGYSCLRAGARFRSLRRVPRADGNVADLSVYPARRGYEDLVMLVGEGRARLGWTAVACPREGYVWFALKDPRVLTNTVLWFSNGGRHYPPWNGRHVNTLGLEEVTSYFHYGLAESRRRQPGESPWRDDLHDAVRPPAHRDQLHHGGRRYSPRLRPRAENHPATRRQCRPPDFAQRPFDHRRGGSGIHSTACSCRRPPSLKSLPQPTPTIFIESHAPNPRAVPHRPCPGLRRRHRADPDRKRCSPTLATDGVSDQRTADRRQ